MHVNRRIEGKKDCGEVANKDRVDTTTCSSSSLSETQESGSLAYFYDSQTTHILSPISPRLVWILYVTTLLQYLSFTNIWAENQDDRIRWQDRETSNC